MGFLRVAAIVVLTAVGVQILPRLLMSPPPLEFHGTTEKGWESVADIFKELLETHPTSGYEYTVYHMGKKVVDLRGGYADITTLEPYRENTLTSLFSATKGVSTLCVALLVDRGLLDYKKPVAHYWPEFAAKGKEAITVETLLSHQAGLYTISEGWSLFDILDNPERISRQLAEQEPLWKPGTKHGYHITTIAMYMNELIRRVDPKHRPLHQFFKEEFAEPLGLDIFIGLPLSENYRVAKSEGLGFSSFEDWYALLFDEGWKMVKLALSADSKYSEALRDIKDPPDFAQKGNNPYIRQIPCGSFSGYGTASDLAKLMGIIANGGVHDGRTYISPRTTALLAEALVEGPDEVMLVNAPYGRGTTPFKNPLGGRMFGTPGAGGNMVYGDLEHKLGLAFLTNKLYSGLNPISPQYRRLLEATYHVLQNIN